MRKQARRLWFGDWQRDQEPELPPSVAADPDQDDTIVIRPEDEADVRYAAEHRRRTQRRLVGLAAFALFFALGFALSAGHKDKPVASEAPPVQAPLTQVPQTQPQVPQSQVPQVPQGGGFGGSDLTGADATKAAQAALAKYPGSVERVTHGPGGGGYVVHVFQADGNEVHVLLDDQFKVQGSDAGGAPPRNNVGPGSGSGTSQ